MIPNVSDRFAGLEQVDFRKRSSLLIERLLVSPRAVEQAMAALDEFMADDAGG